MYFMLYINNNVIIIIIYISNDKQYESTITWAAIWEWNCWIWAFKASFCSKISFHKITTKRGGERSVLLTNIPMDMNKMRYTLLFIFKKAFLDSKKHNLHNKD